MVSNELLGFIEENLEQNRVKCVLFIGDPYQLPPVDEGTNGVVTLPKQYILTEIVRQAKDSYITMIANELKECIRLKKYSPIEDILDIKRYPQLKVFRSEKEFLNDFTHAPEWYKKKNIVLAFSNNAVDQHNSAIRQKYWIDHEVDPSDPILPGGDFSCE